MSKIIPVRPVQNVPSRHLFRNRKTMWQMIRETAKGRYKMSFFTLSTIVISALYVISPIDLVPDQILVLGWIDDGLTLYLLFRRLAAEAQRFSRFKAMERKNC
jgi:uncharacterized membrane protein YkvA (DUF1232 family)